MPSLNTRIAYSLNHCSLGAILVAESPRGLCAILLGDEPEELLRDLRTRFPNAEPVGDDPAFLQRMAQIVSFVEAPTLSLDLPLDIQGTVFQKQVWQVLQAIPPGTTISYTELAKRVGSPNATRAVASACGANSLAVAIPCHRVISQSGALTGYRWGLERKRKLLEKESACPTPPLA